MTLIPASSPGAHPVAPIPRAASSYVIDALAMAVYIAAIAYASMLLDIPHPLILAGAIAVGSLAILNSRATTHRKRPRASAS